MRKVNALGLLAVLACPLGASATTMVAVTPAEVAARADVVVHGVVHEVQRDTSTSPNGPFRTKVTLEVLQQLKGVPAHMRILKFSQPGGEAAGKVMMVPGLPRLSPGDEVVLAARRGAEEALVPVGLGQGVWFVDRRSEVPVARQRVQGATILEGSRRTAAGALAEAPPLADLWSTLAAAVRP